MSKLTDTLNSFLSFRLGDELFAANVSKVLEILEIPKITKVPRSPAFMRGVVNLRGNVLPVIDARTKFGMPEVADTINSCILVLNLEWEGKEIVLGTIVDQVQEVMEIDESSIQSLPAVGAKYKTEFIDGMVKQGDQFIMLLNIDLLFSNDEANIIQDITSMSDSQTNKN